jgi:ParB family transcriptional regulator, chromosome partitioning protein
MQPATNKKRGLGRGLDALLGASEYIAQANSEEPMEGLHQLPVEQIQRGSCQPRIDMHPDTLQELADSIRAQGLVQPIVVRPRSVNRYEIIAGERRWRAAQLAGLDSIPAIVRDVPDKTAVAMALIENIQREDLNPLEEANALHRLQEEFSLTHQQVAETVGRSRAAVSNLLRLLELTSDVKQLIIDGHLEMGHGRALLALKGVHQIDTARKIVDKGLSVRATEQLVRRLQDPDRSKPTKTTQDPNIRQLQDQLAERLGARVSVVHGRKGKGKLVIQYNSLDELDGILGHIK